MTQTISINLGGMLFHINEEAYKLLNNYLNAIEKQFTNENEKAEIISDIETRIAELLYEQLKDIKDLVTTPLVNHVITTMGEPHDFKDTEEPQKEKPKYKRTTKRMYRDPEQRMLGGVCAGLGAYFGVDSWIFRAVFIAFTPFFLSSFFIYLILWITIPEAITTAQKLEMQGKPIDVENIKEKVKEEFDKIKNRMNS